MKKFSGFTSSETFSRIPDSFFRELLAGIDDAEELKVTLHAMWRIGNMEGSVHILQAEDFAGLLPDPGPALKKAVERGTLLAVLQGSKTCYFLNSPRGRLAAQAFENGKMEIPAGSLALPSERPNIFKLYEENIGPLTPLIADALRDAEQTYPPDQVAEALEIAVKGNKRNWKYVEAILRRWKEEGHAQEQDRRDAKETRGRDVTRKVEDFIKK